MKQLVILCYPSNENLIKVVGTEVSLLYEKYKLETEIRDLYSLGFNPVLSNKDIAAVKSGNYPEDVKVEQEYVKKADIITFIYPMWVTGIPAMLKGYMDRVFSEGFAFNNEPENHGGLLEGKKIVLINTYENFPIAYNNSSYYYYSNDGLKNLLHLFGMEVILHSHIDHIPDVEEYEQFKIKLSHLKEEIKKAIVLKSNCRLTIPTVFF